MADEDKVPETPLQNPWVGDETIPGQDKLADLDPQKVVGKYAMQPDPNEDIQGPPPPNVPEGVNEAPADDDEDAGAIGPGAAHE